MKKIIWIGMVLMASFVILKSEKEAYPAHDKVGSERPAMWRSTRTCAAENFMLISSGSIHFHGVIVVTPTVNNDSYLSIYNSSSTNTSLGLSTAIGPLSTNVNQNISGAFPQKIEWNVPLSSGMVINKIGAACTEILWDYFVPKTPSEYNHMVPLRP